MAKRTRRRDASRSVDPFAKRRVQFQRALAAVGLADAFARLPLYVREHFWQRKFPDLTIEFDPTFPPVHQFRRILEKRLRDATIDVEGQRPVRVHDLLSVIAGLHVAILNVSTAGLPKDVLEFLRVAEPRLKACIDRHLPSALSAHIGAVMWPLTMNSRLDSRLLAVKFECGTLPDGRLSPRCVFSAAEPQVRSVTLDGEPRPMYRVPLTTFDGVRWLAWTPEQAGRAAPAGAPREYPVFVQSHALKHMYKRVNLPAAAPHLDAWLTVSLREPNIVERLPGGDLLVEFRIRENRLGYFVVSLTQGLAAVRTFLFLTMEPSPESRRLRDRLRLTRREVDWLGLSDLAAFTQTDLREDPTLRPLFESCGCGHLFDLDQQAFAPEPKPFAAEVKRYLRMAG